MASSNSSSGNHGGGGGGSGSGSGSGSIISENETIRRFQIQTIEQTMNDILRDLLDSLQSDLISSSPLLEWLSFDSDVRRVYHEKALMEMESVRKILADLALLMYSLRTSTSSYDGEVKNHRQLVMRFHDHLCLLMETAKKRAKKIESFRVAAATLTLAGFVPGRVSRETSVRRALKEAEGLDAEYRCLLL